VAAGSLYPVAMKKMLLALVLILSAGCHPCLQQNRSAELLRLRHTEQLRYRVENDRIVYTAPDGSRTILEAVR